MIIAVDFDGTCTTHAYPLIGLDIGAAAALRGLVTDGHRLILWTMRSGAHLEDAVQWFAAHEVALFGVNENPEQREWTDSPKVYAQLYIDDAAFGAPLIYPTEGRPYFDWQAFITAWPKDRSGHAKERP